MITLMEETEAVEVWGGRGDAPLLITCEHASQRLPDGWAWPAPDQRLVGTHWAYDLGAADLAKELAAPLDAMAILSRFTRLLVDPNRPEDSATLFRDRAEGAPVELNRDPLHEHDRGARIERFLRPYHRAVDSHVEASSAPVLLSMHTFTPEYEGQKRSLEIGVLFDQDEALAERTAAALARRGYATALNEPYSGRGGLMYAVDRHARRHARQAVELEVRQDLAVDPEFRRGFVAVLVELFG